LAPVVNVFILSAPEKGQLGKEEEERK